MHIISEIVPLTVLHEDENNARAHNERNLNAIKSSLKRFRQVEPLIVRAETGKVIGGNGRLTAMRELGWKTAKVNIIEGLSDEEAIALGIALNRTAELATWDSENLRKILDTLPDGGASFAEFGFELPELKMAAHISSVPVSSIDPEEEWEGMPEYKSDYINGKYKFTVHSDDDEFIKTLSELTGLKITEKTKTVWYPPQQPDDIKDLSWVADEA